MRMSLLLRTANSISRRSTISINVNPLVFRSFRSSSVPRLAMASDGSKTKNPCADLDQFWNRETSKKGQYDHLFQISPESVQKEAKILCLTAPVDDANDALLTSKLPFGSRLLGSGESLADFDHLQNNESPNVLFVSPSCPIARVQVPLVLAAFPTIEWVHCRSAGIDFVVSEALATYKDDVVITNAKGQFSSTLAEYTMMACSYFSKDLPRLMRQKGEKNWEKYDVEEIRGKIIGIVGYGDIGRACAKLAHAYGMKIIALRRHPQNSEQDPLCDVIYGSGKENLNKLMSECDYIVCAAPCTAETRGMVNTDAFKHVKQDAVFINVGRGTVVDEDALIDALQSGRLRGAALDVFFEEPLPESSKFWDQDNVLLSPHNMDQTTTFMHEATDFFVNENLPRFICGEKLLNPVDPVQGY